MFSGKHGIRSDLRSRFDGLLELDELIADGTEDGLLLLGEALGDDPVGGVDLEACVYFLA